MRSIYGATTSVRIYDAEFRNQNKGFSDTDEVRQVGNAAGQGKTGSYGGAGCGEQPAKVLLAGGLSPATKKARSGPGMRGNAERLSDCVSMIS